MSLRMLPHFTLLQSRGISLSVITCSLMTMTLIILAIKLPLVDLELHSCKWHDSIVWFGLQGECDCVSASAASMRSSAGSLSDKSWRISEAHDGQWDSLCLTTSTACRTAAFCPRSSFFHCIPLFISKCKSSSLCSLATANGGQLTVLTKTCKCTHADTDKDSVLYAMEQTQGENVLVSDFSSYVTMCCALTAVWTLTLYLI